MRLYSAEPWSMDYEKIRDANKRTILYRSDLFFAESCGEQTENARRIVECVNLCAGIPTDRVHEALDDAHRDGYMTAVADAVAMVKYHCDCKHADVAGIVGLLRNDPTFGYKGRPKS